MRGADSKQEAMFSYVSPESRIPTTHPLRPIRAAALLTFTGYNLIRMRNLLAPDFR
jgi:hypothetical protein